MKAFYLESSEPVSEQLLTALGVIYLPSPDIQLVKKQRGYSFSDIVTISPTKFSREILSSFFQEHLHADEEVRYIVQGSGFFDVRDTQDNWIRIALVERDLIVLPAGIYHRFCLDESQYVKAMRLFKGEPVWTPHNRSEEEHPVHKSYVQSL